jgi:transaldolase
MNEPTRLRHAMGQSLWLDTVSRDLLDSGALSRCIANCSVTGLSFNAANFAQAVGQGTEYDASIRALDHAGTHGEDLLVELVLQDLTRAADLFQPVFASSQGDDGWVSLDASPLLANDAVRMAQEASHLFGRAARQNLLVGIAGTVQGLQAAQDAIFAGVPVNLRLLYSVEHYLAAADAHMSAMERRLAAGLNLQVTSVASVGVAEWDALVMQELAPAFNDRLGIAMAMRVWRAHLELLTSDRWQRLATAGARPQRLVWGGTQSRRVGAGDTLYVQALAARTTIITLSESTLVAFADHGQAGTAMPADGGYADAVLEEFRREGVDDTALAGRLQRNALTSACATWQALLHAVAGKCAPALQA